MLAKGFHEGYLKYQKEHEKARRNSKRTPHYVTNSDPSQPLSLTTPQRATDILNGVYTGARKKEVLCLQPSGTYATPMMCHILHAKYETDPPSTISLRNEMMSKRKDRFQASSPIGDVRYQRVPSLALYTGDMDIPTRAMKAPQTITAEDYHCHHDFRTNKRLDACYVNIEGKNFGATCPLQFNTHLTIPEVNFTQSRKFYMLPNDVIADTKTIECIRNSNKEGRIKHQNEDGWKSIYE